MVSSTGYRYPSPQRADLRAQMSKHPAVLGEWRLLLVEGKPEVKILNFQLEMPEALQGLRREPHSFLYLTLQDGTLLEVGAVVSFRQSNLFTMWQNAALKQRAPQGSWRGILSTGTAVPK